MYMYIYIYIYVRMYVFLRHFRLEDHDLETACFSAPQEVTAKFQTADEPKNSKPSNPEVLPGTLKRV